MLASFIIFATSSAAYDGINNLYIVLGIIVSVGTILFGVNKFIKGLKTDLAQDITLTVVEKAKTDVAVAVQLAVSQEVKEAISALDYKITQNGKNSNNLGDVAARTEENVLAVKDSLNALIPLVQKNNDVLMKHIGAHIGHGDSWIQIN